MKNNPNNPKPSPEATFDNKGMDKWEAAKDILTGANAWMVLIFLAVVTVLLALMTRRGMLRVDTGKVRLGSDERERNIIRQQVEWAHLYIMSLRAKIKADEQLYGGYFTKYILERCYDKVVEWITLNHLSMKDAYVQIKQEEVCALVYGLGVGEEYKTPEFKARMCAWVEELIGQLVKIREVYK